MQLVNRFLRRAVKPLESLPTALKGSLKKTLMRLWKRLEKAAGKSGRKTAKEIISDRVQGLDL